MNYKNNGYTCLNCGFKLPPYYLYVEVLIFPINYLDIALRIFESEENYRCPQCEDWIPNIYKEYIFVFQEIKLIVTNYTEKDKININDFLSSKISELSSENIESYHFERIFDLRQMLSHVRKGIAKFVNIYWASDSGNIKQDEELYLLAPRKGIKRGLAYHTALLMMTHKGLASLWGYPMGRNMVILNERKNEEIASSVAYLCEKIKFSDQKLNPFELVEANFVSDLFDEDTLAYISKAIDQVYFNLRDGVVKLSAYDLFLFELLYAVICSNFDLPNRRNEFFVIGLYHMFEKEIDITIIDLSDHQKRKLATSSVLLNTIVNTPSINLENQERIIQVANFFGFTEEFMRSYLILLLDQTNLTEFYHSIISDVSEKNNRDMIGDVIELIIGAGSNRSFKAAESLYFDIISDFSDVSDILYVSTQAYAKLLIGEGTYNKAVDVINNCLMMTEKLNDNQKKKHLVLVELGNAFRYLGRYIDALKAYEEAESFIDQDLTNRNYRILIGNKAKVLRDEGFIRSSISILSKLVNTSSGEEEFSNLFALGLSYYQFGDFIKANEIFDQALEYSKTLPITEQVLRFHSARLRNCQKLGIDGRESFEILLAVLEGSKSDVEEKKLFSSRMVFVIISNFTANLLKNRTLVDERLYNSLKSLFTDKNLLTLVSQDPELSVLFAMNLINFEEYTIAKSLIKKTENIVKNPLLLIRNLIVSGIISGYENNWENLFKSYLRAQNEILEYIRNSSPQKAKVAISETVPKLIQLADLAVNSPDNLENNKFLSMMAEFQGSIKLFVVSAKEFLPIIDLESFNISNFWDDYFDNNVRHQIIVQFLDTSEYQLPIISSFKKKYKVFRGTQLKNDKFRYLSDSIFRRMTRTLSHHTLDLIETFPNLKMLFESLKIDIQKNSEFHDKIVIIPSPLLSGIPFHLMYPKSEISYFPGISFYHSLYFKVRQERLSNKLVPKKIVEITSWTYNDNQKIRNMLTDGAEELSNILKFQNVEYEAKSEILASKSAIIEVFKNEAWIKLSCHGLADLNTGMFALVVSDGKQLAPGLSSILNNYKLVSGYLLTWEEIMEQNTKVRFIFSTACSTGNQISNKGGEQLGFARAFLETGGYSFIAPMWPVNAQGAQTFINHLIDLIIKNPTKEIGELFIMAKQNLTGLPLNVVNAFILNGFDGSIVD